jgi:hypothetical protein
MVPAQVEVASGLDTQSGNHTGARSTATGAPEIFGERHQCSKVDRCDDVSE